MIVSNDTIMKKPPYHINKKILDLLSEISRSLGKLESLHLIDSDLKLRKKNRIKTIHGSVAIEGNELSLEQITDIIEGKRVLGKKKEILEVQNTIKLYQDIKKFNYKKEKSFLQGHQVLMKDLLEDSGKYRSSNVGVLAGAKVIHVAPQAKFVNKLMSDLFDYTKNDDEHLLIKSCVFHYELEFIHPFSDGNGRMGRFWQSLILLEFNKIFEFIPVESIVFKKQKQYYKVLNKCDKKGDSTEFIEFLLSAILDAILENLRESKPVKLSSSDRIEIARNELQKQSFSRKDYIKLFNNISTATANRDLKSAVEKNIFKKTGDKRTSLYQVLQKLS